MFKKIEIWILYLVILLSIPATIIFGALVRQELVGNKKMEWFSEKALFLAEIPINLKRIFITDEKLKDRFPLLDGFDGTPNSFESYLLLSRYDAGLREGIVQLVDLKNFKVLHTWNPDINEFNKPIKKINEFKYLNRDSNNSRFTLDHPLLFDDGDLVFHGGPLRRIDQCSKLIFQNTNDIFHHSSEKDIDGNIWVPSHLYPQTLKVKKIGRFTPADGGYEDDAIVKISPNGKILFEKSVSQIFIENDMEYLLFAHGSKHDRDVIHLNDIQPVDFDGEFWMKGDLFLSLRHQSMVLLYRPSTNKIIWKGTGPFFYQHDVDILNNHKISVFNNNSKSFVGGEVVDGHNEVIIYDFKTNKYSSYLRDSLIKNDVRTITEGRSQILPNGNLLVEETNYGRSLYFNSDGSLRWTHVNRSENGEVYTVSWSRILYDDKDTEIVKEFLLTRDKCND